MERGFGGRMVRTQIFKARCESRDSLLQQGNTRTSKIKLTFNITIQRFRMLETYCRNFHIFLAPDKEHKHVFPAVPILGFWNGKSLREYLVRAVLPKMGNAWGSKLWGKGTCQACDYVIKTNTYTTKACRVVFKIQSCPLNYNFIIFWGLYVFYLLRCKICEDTP